MPVKIGFTVVSSTGEDERYRATELNYHGPTVRGWRSPINSTYPQEIVMQLNVAAVVHRIQILSHQYLIPQKIEIWTSEGSDYDPSLSPGAADSFEYLGFITLSDNQSTGFKSRELKSITVPPTTAKYIKLRLHSNYSNEKNLYNQVGVIAVNILGEEVHGFDVDGEVNNNGCYYTSPHCESTLITNPQYVSPYDDLAFEMYVDKDVARIMRVMEAKKHQAVLEERFEYASKLKMALEDLREAGETLGKYEQEKRQAINTEDYDRAKFKKLQIEQYREQVYKVINIEQLLELDGALEENDATCGSLVNRSLRKQELAPPPPESLEIDPAGEAQRGTPSPCQDFSAEDNRDWTYSEHKFPYPQTPSHLIHSQSQTSFERHGNRDDSPPTLTPRYMPAGFSNPQLAEYPTTLQHSHIFSTQRYQPKTPVYNCHTWQAATSVHESSEMYHSMPMPQTVERKILPPDKSKTAEFPLPQRNYSDGEIKAASHKTVDFESPVAQTMETAVDTADIAVHVKEDEEIFRPKSPADTSTSLSKSPPSNAIRRPSSLRGSLRRRNKSSDGLYKKSSYEAYEERMLPALRHYHANEIVRECQLGLVEPSKKSKLNEREKKQAALPITVFGIELVEKFYSKHFADKEEGLKQLQEYLKRQVQADGDRENPEDILPHSPNKVARATIFLLHRALRDKVYSVYSSAADTIRLFFSEYVPKRVSSTEVARSVEKLLPELIAKSGDATPRIHNMAAHTLLSMADCKEVRELHIIPVHLSRPLTSSVHPRLALSRLEMIEQLILNHGISTDKQSGLTCRTLAEFGSSGLHHPAEAVRKVSERILIQVYRVNPRLVRKQLPPDDDITRRNLLYRQLFQEFDFMDLQRKREMNEKVGRIPAATRANDNLGKVIQSQWENFGKQEEEQRNKVKVKKEKILPSQLPKRTVNQQTSPMKPFSPHLCYPPAKEELLAARQNGATHHRLSPSREKAKGSLSNGDLEKRKGMTRIAEEKTEGEAKRLDEDVALKFPNLVDSVRVAEERLTQKGFRNLKSLKYIFPTTYIGNSTTSQVTVNTCDSVNSVCKIMKKPDLSIAKQQSTPHSGIPVPTNGRFLTPILPNKKLGRDADKTVPGVKKDIQERRRRDSTGSNTTGSPGVGEDKKDPMGTAEENDKEKTVKGKADQDSSSTSLMTPPSEAEDSSKTKISEPKETLKMCIFCFASDNWSTEESLNNHYWKSCPMLTRCIYCKEVVEISGLIQHRLDDCEHKHLFQKCETCQEAIPKDVLGDHDCAVSETKNSKLRCTMCHCDVGSEEGWREHLMGSKLCPNHPRKHLNPARSDNRVHPEQI